VGYREIGGDKAQMTEFSSGSLSAFGKLSAGDGDLSGADEVHSLIVVARDQPDLWYALARQFTGDQKVQVVLDRRRCERRQRVQMLELDQRGMDRRHPTCPEHDVRQRSFVIIRRQDGTLED
jgi:hypothetical protein